MTEHAFSQAQQYIPGGVNSPVRAFKGVGGTPKFIDRAVGSKLYDIEGNAYIDFIGSWGALILGHGHPKVIDAVSEAMQKGLGFGAPTQRETDMAKAFLSFLPYADKVRFVNSGTEATMTALRMARAWTGRNKIVKFEGCYHGHSDALLVKAGSGMLTLGEPSSPGVVASLASLTLTAEFNHLESVAQLFEAHGSDIAAIIVEPVAGNMNCILPTEGFLSGLRALCDTYDSILILDEVMTGFRVGQNSAQGIYNVKPDLSCFGKIIGGGLPVGAITGTQALMDTLSPLGAVYQAGTLSGNPLAMAAGLATLEVLKSESLYQQLSEQCEALCNALQATAAQHNTPLHINQLGAMFGFFIGATEPVERFSQVASGVDAFNRFFHLMLDQGVYLAPSAYEAGFISTAHTTADIEAVYQAADVAFSKLSQ